MPSSEISPRRPSFKARRKSGFAPQDDEVRVAVTLRWPLLQRPSKGDGDTTHYGWTG